MRKRGMTPHAQEGLVNLSLCSASSAAIPVRVAKSRKKPCRGREGCKAQDARPLGGVLRHDSDPPGHAHGCEGPLIIISYSRSITLLIALQTFPRPTEVGCDGSNSRATRE